MATFAQYILSEPDFIKKVDIVNFLRKKQNIYFNTSVILKAEIARQFIDTMKLDVDRNVTLTEKENKKDPIKQNIMNILNC